MILPLDEVREILGPVADGLTDLDLAHLAATVEQIARWQLEDNDAEAGAEIRRTA